MNLLKTSFFGLSIYEKNRVVFEKVEIDTDQLYCDDLGLYVLNEYPKLEYNFSTFWNHIDWETIAKDTIALTVLYLLSKGTLDLWRFHDETHYFSKYFKSIEKGYILRIGDLYDENDIICRNLLSAINRAEQDYGQHIKIINILRVFITKYLGFTSTKPEKEFLIRNLRTYSERHEWLDIDKTTKYFGFKKNYGVKINTIYIPRLSIQFDALLKTDMQLKTSNEDYKDFVKYLHYWIDKDFRSRKANND